MKTIKVIDLLNKIANGEEVPKKIRVHHRVFERYLNHNAYLNTKDEENYKYLTDIPRLYNDDRDWLNEEIEIIEEDKKIEKLYIRDRVNDILIGKSEKICYATESLVNKEIALKINEIIDKLNEMSDKE